MCGIVGLLNLKNEKFPIGAMNGLISQSRERGRQATGVFAVNSKGEYALFKEPGFLMHLDPEDKDLQDCKLMLAHVRKSSAGSFFDNRCNHPHKVGNLVMIHNGTATTFLSMAKDAGIENPMENDSFAIISLIELVSRSVGVEQAILDVLSHATSSDSFAIALYDISAGDLYLIRKEGGYATGINARPLFVSARDKEFIFVSQPEYISRSIGHNFRMGFISSFAGQIGGEDLYKANIFDDSVHFHWRGEISKTPTKLPFQSDKSATPPATLPKAKACDIEGTVGYY